MGIFNYIGLIIICLIMIPNIIFAFTNRDGFINIYKNKGVEICEQIGRYGCFIFMIVNIPYTYFNFWFTNAMIVYAIVNTLLVFGYLVIWIACFKKNSVFKSLSLSILPSVMFLFSGVMLASIPLIICALIFAPTHILISYKNSVSK
ncbi:MAG TPA: hypothetical protein DD621_03490 [Clostridiales bacterium]|nr:hypothetical protein [Clostridiales bacterium]